MQSANKFLVIIFRLFDVLSYLLIGLGGIFFFKMLGASRTSSDNKITLILGIIAFVPRIAFWLAKFICVEKNEEFLSEGKKHFENKEYSKAMEVLNKAIKLFGYFGGNPYMYIMRSKVSLALKNDEDASSDAVVFINMMELGENKKITEDEVKDANEFIEKLKEIENSKELVT